MVFLFFLYLFSGSLIFKLHRNRLAFMLTSLAQFSLTMLYIGDRDSRPLSIDADKVYIAASG